MLSAAAGNAIGQDLREVVYTTTPESLKGYLCRPAGTGPFPAGAFNHGGVGNLMAAARGASIRAAVIMASAMPPAQSGFTLDDAPKIRVPVFLLVAENDTGSKKTQGQNTMETMRRMSAALTAAGNTPKLTVYPGYGGDGHEMFFEIGAYWTNIIDFLKKHL